jgi:hypothetical protein
MEVDRAPHQDHSDTDSEVASLVLGAKKLLDDFAREAAASRTDGEPLLPDDDPMLAAALGFISLRRTLDRWLRQTASAPAPVDDVPPSPDADSALLR